MTEPKHPVAGQRAAPYGAILWPALRIRKNAVDEALCDPSEMCKKGRVDVNERISCRELLPGRRDTAKALNDPLISVRSSACLFRYSSCGTSLPPARNLIVSTGYKDSPVTSANRLASVDLPAPALPNTATFLIASTCQPNSLSKAPTNNGPQSEIVKPFRRRQCAGDYPWRVGHTPVAQ